MLKLRAIVNQLPTADYRVLENQLIQNKADNYLLLLRTYKENNQTDEGLIKKLNSNTNSFHTLKSRLYSKIQQHLVENISANKADILNQLANITKYCYNTPCETADAILTKLVNDLKAFDMPSDLIIVYSALKKIHLHSPKYHEYSQLYNKHLAYMMGLEKAEELLGSFMRTLSQYQMSKSPGLLEILNLINQEIKNLYLLNRSNQIEIIKNIIAVHLHLFTKLPKENDESTDDLLLEIESIVQKFPNNSVYQVYASVANFLRYEYYTLINENKKAQSYFEIVNNGIKHLLLLNNLGLTYHFLYSKIINFTKYNMEKSLEFENDLEDLVFDSKNINVLINVQFYNAISKFYNGKYRESISILNNLLNTASFKSLLHIEIEIKLTLAYIYVKQNEDELAEGLLRSIYRKIKAQDLYSYENAVVFSKIINLLMDFDSSDASKLRILKLIRLFEFENSGERGILKFMESEISKLKKALDSSMQKRLEF